MQASKLIATLLCVSTLAGCAQMGAGNLGGGSYERAEARRVMSVRMGIVEGVRPVKLEGSSSGIGTLAGAAIGGVAGSTVGKGKGAGIAAIVGAVAGGVAGSALEGNTTAKAGIEVTIKMDNGELLAVVQEDGGEGFHPGERVRLVQDGRTSRVTR